VATPLSICPSEEVADWQVQVCTVQSMNKFTNKLTNKLTNKFTNKLTDYYEGTVTGDGQL